MAEAKIPGPAGPLRQASPPRALSEEDRRLLGQFMSLARLVEERGLVEGPMGVSALDPRVRRLEAAVSEGEGEGKDRAPSMVEVQADMADELYGHDARPATDTEPGCEPKAGLVPRVEEIEDALPDPGFYSLVIQGIRGLEARLDGLEKLLSVFTELATAISVILIARGVTTREELDANAAEVRKRVAEESAKPKPEGA